MSRIVRILFVCCFIAIGGCTRSAPPTATPPAAATATTPPVEEASAGEVESDTESLPVDVEDAADLPADLASASEPETPIDPNARVDLKLEGISFTVPASWRKVKPQTNIVEAEFELPHVEGDAHDGRLTLMSSGGDPEEVIANRTAEFVLDAEHPAKVEPLPIGEIEAKWVDLRGEWKGPAFRPVEPRLDYRMLLVIIPFTERSAFYAKLTGPRETIAAREAEFREFVESVKITPPGFE